LIFSKLEPKSPGIVRGFFVREETRPNVRDGSKAVFPAPKSDFRYSPGSGHCLPAYLARDTGAAPLRPQVSLKELAV
jgi:hypothetical protein